MQKRERNERRSGLLLGIEGHCRRDFQLDYGRFQDIRLVPQKDSSTYGVRNGTALRAVLSRHKYPHEAAAKQQLSSVSCPAPRVAPRKLRLLRKIYNVDMLLGFVLGVARTQ
jgi:hypothetical protein